MRRLLIRLVNSKDADVEAHLVLLCLGALTFLALSVYHVVGLGLPFDPSAFGEGLGFLLAGGGAAAWGQGLQRSSERNRKDGTSL